MPPSITASRHGCAHACHRIMRQQGKPARHGGARALGGFADQPKLAALDPNGDSTDARGDMLLASAMVGIAFDATRLGLVHAFAVPLGNKFGIARGLVNATMLPPVMRTTRR
nr:iron-containing alcohol dehydrogenase [Burkholderia sp. PAMC 28687]